MKLLTKAAFGLVLVIIINVVDNASLASAEPPKAQSLVTVEIISTDAYRMREYRRFGELIAIFVVPKHQGSPYLLIDREGRGNFVRESVEDWPTGRFLESEIFSIGPNDSLRKKYKKAVGM